MVAGLIKRRGKAHGDTNKVRTDANYRIWQLPGAGTVAAYYVESTAPNNIDEPYQTLKIKELPRVEDEAPGGDGESEAPWMPDDTATATLAAELDRIATPSTGNGTGGGTNPEVVFLVNGFNTPRAGSTELAARAHRAMRDDKEIQRHPGMVFIGYRWPSEKIGSTWRNGRYAASQAFRAAFRTVLALLAIGIGDYFDIGKFWFAQPTVEIFWASVQFMLLALAVALLLVLSQWIPLPEWVVGIAVGVAWLIAVFVGYLALWRWKLTWGPPVLSSIWLGVLLFAFTVPVGLFILRIVVYFRDVYRATNYGVPDLLQLIRTLDGELAKTPLGQRIANGGAPRVKISFICHSLGALVVTNLVRILSDVFAVQDTSGFRVDIAAQRNSRQAGQQVTRVDTGIGTSLAFGRLVLLSPDIPAATLLTNRANFLHSALRRFEEAYLFSSEGDEVLRTVSSLANYFIFPNARQEHGYRLGNAEVRPGGMPGYGIFNDTGQWHEDEFLRSIRIGQRSLFALHQAVNGAQTPVRNKHTPTQTPFPLQMTYFDCTDYRDADTGDGLLTRALGKPQLNSWDHTGLLVQYLANWYRMIDVHGGYFHGVFSQELIYRLACLGYTGLLGTYAEGQAGLDKDCRAKQLRVLLSPDRQPGQGVRRDRRHERHRDRPHNGE